MSRSTLVRGALLAVFVVCASTAHAQLPREVSTPQPRLPMPRPTSGVVALGAGGAHTCAVLATGSVRCWGLNTDGQLGQADSVGAPVPVPSVTGARSIAAGRAHTCAARGDGTVVCWGSNEHGQLGRPAIERGTLSPAPAAVTGITEATQVAAGADHTCALLRDGRVACWGANGAGQLGDGSTEDSATPATVRAISTATAITTGASHSCALLGDGTVRCWGVNDSGQLGTADPADPAVSPFPQAVGGVTSATAIAAGHAHTCALSSDRRVWCWGSNDAGQLGTGRAMSSATPMLAVDIADAIAIGAGGRQTCAVISDGTQRCTGADGPPQAEHVTFALRTSTPLQTPGIEGAAGVAPGASHNCILLRSGAVRCRGNNSDGQLGDGSFRTSRPPVAVRGIERATALASGDAHSCALATDGTVHCWGSNVKGQVGRPVVELSAQPLAVAGVAGATATVSGRAHACALTGDGSVWCWGRNRDGQLGRGWMSAGSPRAERVAGLPKATSIAAGADFTCALVEGGAVHCWGRNSRGQLGDGTTRASELPTRSQRLTGVTAIAAGGSQACTVLAGGGVSCWGVAGTAPADASLTAGPVAVPSMQMATAVTVGLSFGCAMREGLTLVCWGTNDTGQLGTPEVPAAIRPVMVTGVAYPVTASAGSFHACAVRRDGKVRCWGRSDVGQLGRSGTGQRSLVPVTVQGLENVAAVSAGAMHTCALLADGTVRCWGSNESGQLARDSSVTFSHNVVRVEFPAAATR